ncbi:MAG: PAS domain S-box protein, partial [Opitutae bacterium]
SIIITNLSGAIEYVNSEFTRISGYESAEVLGMNPRLLRSGQSSPATYQQMWQTISTGGIWYGELFNRKKNGEYYWVSLVISPLRDAAGHITHFVSVNKDVTETRRLQAALAESNDRLHLATQAGGVGIWEYDLGQQQLVWDDRRLHHRGPPEPGGAAPAAWQQGVHPADRARTDQEIQLALHGEKDFDSEFRVVWPDGSIHDLRAIARVQRNAAGEPTRMIGTTWDITRDKQAAFDLRRSESLLRLMLQASPLGFLVVDNRTDAILHFNQRFCEIWGIEPLAERMRRGELKNNDIIPYCLPVLADVPAFATSCVALQDEHIRTVLEDEIAFTQGRTIRRFTTQIRDDLDQYHGRFYIFEDITRPKQHTREILAMLDKEREVSEMKTRFIAVTSHEFRTPMSTAMGSVDILVNHFDQLVPTKRLELFSRITSSLRRMAVMLDEVLLLNRIDGGRTEVQFAPVDLRLFLKNVIEEIRLGDRTGHRFDLQAAEAIEIVDTDANLLHHVLSNLLSNAVRYSPAGTLITTCLESESGRVRLSVTDQGIGVPAADQKRIFEPFERGSNVGSVTGTGLGLSIVKRMTGLLGGTIALSAPATGGSCFTLVLPVQPEPPKQD